MKKFIQAFMALVALSSGAMSVSRPADPVLMTVDGRDVPLSEFLYLYHKNLSLQQSPADIDAYLGMFVDFKLKVADAISNGLDTAAEYRNEYLSFRHELTAPYMIDSAVIDSFIAEAYSHLAEDIDVSHILMRGPRAKETLDSIRQAVENGEATFEEMATKYSADPYAAANRGRLGWITAGRLPYMFEDTAYDTPAGHVSATVTTPLGEHIIKVNARRPAKGEVLASHILKLTRGKSKAEAEKARKDIDSIYSALISGADFKDTAIRESEDPGTASKGGLLPWFSSGMMVQPFDSIAFSMADNEISRPFASAFGYHIILKHARRSGLPLDSVKPKILETMSRDGRMEAAKRSKLKSLRGLYGNNLTDAEIEDKLATELEASVPDFRNLLREYSDGILLFAISDEKVWQKASTDTAGLEKYFIDNKDRYRWDSPRFKGYIVTSLSDSIKNEADSIIAHAGPAARPEDVAKALHHRLGNGIKIEKVIAPQGKNPIVDHLAFGAPAPRERRKKAYTSFLSQIISAPTCASDTGGEVISDYQDFLESRWIELLREKYPVVIHREILKNIK